MKKSIGAKRNKKAKRRRASKLRPEKSQRRTAAAASNDDRMNRFGLSRGDFRSADRREVRQRCYFGCVICGRMPYEYEHYDPEFKDAKTHSVDRIALLCPIHHRDKTSGRLSVAKIRAAHARPHNAIHDPLWIHSLGSEPINLRFAGVVLSGTSVGVNLEGRDIIRLYRDEQYGEWMLTGSFQNHQGTAALTFEANEVRAFSGSWDVELEGTRLTVRAGPGELITVISFDAAQRMVSVDRLKMLSNGYWFD
jgi:hypothetical protein